MEDSLPFCPRKRFRRKDIKVKLEEDRSSYVSSGETGLEGVGGSGKRKPLQEATQRYCW